VGFSPSRRVKGSTENVAADRIDTAVGWPSVTARVNMFHRDARRVDSMVVSGCDLLRRRAKADV
jgi:hypothetical protein